MAKRGTTVHDVAETAAAAGERIEGALEESIRAVPARFMRPQLLLMLVVGGLVIFGLLMIYSASSVGAIADFGDGAHYVKRQIALVALGTAAAVFLARTDYHVWATTALPAIWILTTVVLLFTLVLGWASHGAQRWISIAGVTLQPSEFAKVTIVLTAANIAQRYVEDGDLSGMQAVGMGALGVGLPLLLILAQPDKGTTIIAGATVLVILLLSGFPIQAIGVIAGVAIAAVALLSLRDDYSRSRILVLLDPWLDRWGAGYQLIQGFYAFGNGGILGVGLGLSRQKYAYLPEAHNDFIFAIVGEELGLLGTLGVLAAFVALAWLGFQIARYAPDLMGRLIAAGCTTLICVQMLVNVCGVLGIIPLSGKPLPFISYGGSSVIACLMLVGLIAGVSRSSTLPQTVHDRRRSQMQVAGEPEPGGSGGGFRILDGGSSSGGGFQRIDLGPSASERLRGDSSRRGRR